MANLTITIDDELLKKARIRALELGTSVNAILAEYLRAFAEHRQAQSRALGSLVALAETNRSEGGDARARTRGKRTWRRDDLHERR